MRLTVSRIFWIISVRSEIHKVIKRCLIFTKWTIVNPQFRMADLPTSRVTSSRPFCHVGIDYIGLFKVREDRRRKLKECIAYMQIKQTKAIHIEMITKQGRNSKNQ